MNLDHSSDNHENSISQRTKADVIDLMFSQSSTVLLGHLAIICLYGLWLSPAVDRSLLLSWVIISLVISGARFGLSVAYQKYHQEKLSQALWVRLWSVLTVMMSLSYAYVFIVVTPVERPEYLVGVTAMLFLITGSTALSYAASIYAIALLILPASAITAIYILALGTRETLIAGLVIIMFAAVNLLLVRKVNRAFIKSIELNYQNKQEIEKRKVVERQLYEISRRDSLTGLFNRRYFDEMLEVELGRAYRNHTSLSLVLLDIDHFKEYNDHYGHVAGDSCLVNIGHLIEAQTNRKGDLVARYGGEEFAVILPGIDAKGALAFGHRLQNHVQNQRIEHKATKLTSLKSVTISLGVTSVLPVMKIKPSHIIDQADKALYDAKKDGRNRVKAFSPFGIDHQGLI
ncbi:GGDEF domain-containing protein [Glaciecola sp. SC05]|uniref:GGDEF domain-containing protein n=1 Tax=Glaciecola sp. SC05 TaxID=1987355 RepID=UPI0035279694